MESENKLLPKSKKENWILQSPAQIAKWFTKKMKIFGSMIKLSYKKTFLFKKCVDLVPKLNTFNKLFIELFIVNSLFEKTIKYN